MGMHLQICFESGLLSVTATGSFSLAAAKRSFLEMLAAVVRFQAERVMVDALDLKGNPEMMERFFYGEFAANETLRLVAEQRVSRTPWFAYVLTEPLRDPGRFGETVAVNRGMMVKTFETLIEAFEWLELTPGNTPEVVGACRRT